LEQLNLVSEKGQRNASDEKVIRNEIVCRHGRCCVHTKKGRSHFCSECVDRVSVNVDENGGGDCDLVFYFTICLVIWVTRWQTCLSSKEQR
jgi:sugar/nucleoside kinase (ribokinase family)